MYAAGWDFRQIYVLDADSLNVIDSIPFRGSPLLMGVHPSGDYLHVWSDQFGDISHGTYVISTKTKQIVSASDHDLGLPRFAKHGEYLVQTRSYEGGRFIRSYFCDPLTFVVLDSLPDSLQYWDALNGAETILVEHRGKSTFGLFDLNTGTLQESLYSPTVPGYPGSHPHVWFARVVPGGKQVVLITDASIEMGDLSSGETLIRVNNYGLGQIDVNSEGSYAVVSIPIQNAWTEASPTRLYLFDLRTPSLAKFLKGFSEDNDLECGGLCAFLPDGQRALVGALDGFNYGPLQLFDVEAGTITRWIDLPTEDSDVRCFAVGRAPR